MKYFTSVPTDAVKAIATVTSPYKRCDHVTTTFNVNEGHGVDDKLQLLSLSIGESVYVTQVNGLPEYEFPV